MEWKIKIMKKAFNRKSLSPVCFLCVCPHSGPFVLPVQRALQAIQCVQGNVHPLLLPAALYLLLFIGELPVFCFFFNACTSCQDHRIQFVYTLTTCLHFPLSAGHRFSVPAVWAPAPGPPASALLPPPTDWGSAVSTRCCHSCHCPRLSVWSHVAHQEGMVPALWWRQA